MIKVFVSYSHADAGHVEAFLRHTALLRQNGVADIWYDRKITAGDDFWNRIDEHFADRDVVCLFISSHYLNSPACKKEMETAFELGTKRGMRVLPVILSPCAWTDHPQLQRTLAIPTDGKAITQFNSSDEGWLDVYNHLKSVIASVAFIKEMSFTKAYLDFLNDASLLTKAHGNKEELKIDDIFVSPDLERFQKETEKRTQENFSNLIDEYATGQKIAIVGEDQSGKTTLAKMLLLKLKEKNFIPVYIKDEAELLQGDMTGRVYEALKVQYDIQDVSSCDKSRIVPIIDDFHKAAHKDKVLERLHDFKQIIIIVDAIFDLDVLQEKTVIDFERYRIKQLKPSLRNELIRRWLSVAERPGYDPEFTNSDFEQLDERTEMLNQALGRTLGSGIMPAYPFFLLTLLSNYDALNKPLNEEITSQGYCYQALILLFLAKQRVSNDKIDTYLNFLTEFAHAVFENQSPLSQPEFDSFFNDYSSEYNLTESRASLLKKLKASGIIRVSSLGNYNFDYPYLYYFFAGKYFAEHLDETDADNEHALQEVERILDNLHKNENAYIAIFMVHHSKDKSLIDRIVKQADSLFSTFIPATLNREELAFFRSGEPVISTPALPAANNNAVEQRRKALQRQDLVEEGQLGRDEEDTESELSKELRRSVKTVEVLGCILRNRAGSLKNNTLCSLFEKGMNVHLRVVSSFFDVVQKILSSGDDYDDFIREKILADNPHIQEERAKEMARNFFWNMNFGFIISMVRRITLSLGAKSLIGVSDTVCNRVNTPASFLIKQDIAMRVSKNLRIGEISKTDYKAFSPVTRNALLYFIVQHCQYNRISPADRDELKRLGLNTKLIPQLPKKI